MKKILVTGGAGYIGSHTLVDLVEHGYSPISIDNFCNSLPDALEGVNRVCGQPVSNYPVDLCDLSATRKVFSENPGLDGVIHFAALALVGESVEKPELYFRNNLLSLLNILECMAEFNVPNLIFSSSCSVYGNAEDLPVTEQSPILEAESPYARTKQMGEQMISDFITAHPEIKSVILRYFNPAGAHPSAEIGENPLHPSTHLIPIIMQTAVGKRDQMKVFGTDYNTPDGSCIRDYIHIMDLARAHTLALDFLMEQKMDSNPEYVNLGTGTGVSVLEAIRAFERVTGRKLDFTLSERRPGDVEAIYANNSKARDLLGWQPEFSLDDLVKSAWDWEQKNL